jgi:hypothetical protein
MDCERCIYRDKCQKPWEADKKTQLKHLGYYYKTREDWEENGFCCKFEQEDK